uniref:Large ribosomal subunit protein mL50 n=1 Tax=Cacopsylla melanoneura TaxID=428564 RepID=A0A8D9AQ18_9HEMI
MKDNKRSQCCALIGPFQSRDLIFFFFTDVINMAACTKLSTFLGKSEINRLFFNNLNIFQQQTRTNVNCLGEKRVSVPNFKRKKPLIPPRVNDKIIWRDADAVRDRGFLRPQKEYIPPSDVEARLNHVFQQVAGTTDRSTQLTDAAVKYNLLDSCYEEFAHKIPNSVLHKINTLDDVYHFYQTLVDVRTPLEAMKTRDLPPNLHILYEYHRFADDSSHFNGVTAFPENSNVVTGLKTKKKYAGFEAPRVNKEFDDELKL